MNPLTNSKCLKCYHFNPSPLDPDLCKSCHSLSNFAEKESVKKARVELKERRERIAMTLMAGLYANSALASMTDEFCIKNAIIGADALIAELDKDCE